MRLRITFAKTAHMRFIGHLDLHKAWERTLRRARLPLAYSQGYTPHPRINLASALPLGFTGEGEIVDVWLDGDLPVETVVESLEKAVPPGISVLSAQRVEDRSPTLQTVLEASEYVITFLEPVEDIEPRLDKVLSASSLLRQRRGKDYDLRPLILDLRRLPDDEDGRVRLFVRLMAREGATGRPEELVAELGEKPENSRVHRMGLVFSEATLN